VSLRHDRPSRIVFTTIPIVIMARKKPRMVAVRLISMAMTGLCFLMRTAINDGQLAGMNPWLTPMLAQVITRLFFVRGRAAR
jgi:hypothetical protein